MTVIIFIVPLSAFNQVLDESGFFLVLKTSRVAHHNYRHIREQASESCTVVTCGLIRDRPSPSQFDSFQLWRTMCSSGLLAGITFIIIFNKRDLLAKKIEAGLQFKDFVTSYKDKPNDPQSISKCLTGSVSLGIDNYANQLVLLSQIFDRSSPEFTRSYLLLIDRSSHM